MTEKTALEVISDVAVETTAKIVWRKHWGDQAINALDPYSIERIIEALDAEGFVIVRKDSNRTGPSP